MPTPPPFQPNTSKNEWQKFIASFGYAFSGIWHALRTQRNMRIHLALALVVILVGFLLRITTVEFALIFVAIMLVFMAEMFNTVCEICIDLSTPEYHPQAKIAKDVAAGAVLLNAILSILIGLCVFVPHLWPLVFK